MNESKMFAVLVRNASVMNGRGLPPFTADIGVVATRRVQIVNGRRELQTSLAIEDLGDLRTMSGLRTIDATGMTVVPLIDDALAAGQVIDLPEWKTTAPTAIAVGQAARFALLEPSNQPGKFVVEEVIR
jgi:hypothetical protein